MFLLSCKEEHGLENDKDEYDDYLGAMDLTEVRDGGNWDKDGGSGFGWLLAIWKA